MTTPPDILVKSSRLPCRDQGGSLPPPLEPPASLSLLPVVAGTAPPRENLVADRPAFFPKESLL
jgi:hypothetical protein